MEVGVERERGGGEGELERVRGGESSLGEGGEEGDNPHPAAGRERWEPVAGVTVLYNPNWEVVENIKSYLKPLKYHFVVDNSDRRDQQWEKVVGEIKKLNKVIYLDSGENRGIGFGLNWGAREAAERGAKLLLTMDQDSRFEEGGIERLIECFHREVEREPKLAILSPFHYTLANRPIYNPSKGVEEVFTIMTSGNLLRLDLWEELGGFREEFFIDMVDIEFSLRLQQKGYKIKVCHPVRLFHNMGQSKEVKFLWKRLVTPQYPPIREYYRIRNGFTLVFSNLTPLSQKLSLLKHWFVDIIFLAPYEDSFPRNLLPKGKAVLWGIRDFLRGRYGKLSEKEENELRINSRK